MLTKPAYGRVFFEADSGSNAGGGGNGSAADTNAKPSGQSGESAGFQPITTEEQLNEWKSKTRRHLIAEIKDELKTEQAAKDREAAEQRERDEEVKRGEFDKVRTDLESKLTAADSEVQALAAKVEKYEKLTASRVDAIKGELPAEAVEDFPAEADAIDQLEWLEGRKTLLAKLAPAAANGNGHPRVPATPQAQGNVKQEATSLVSRHAI